jgi:hypothetical protein
MSPRVLPLDLRAFERYRKLAGTFAQCTICEGGLLRHADFESCARADCGIPFARRSGHNQIYCSPECAHVVAQRALRERKKREDNLL